MQGYFPGALPVGGPNPDLGLPLFGFIDHFTDISRSTSANAARWLNTGNSGTMIVRTDTEGGVMRVTTGSTIGHTEQFQLNGSGILIRSDRIIELVGRFALGDADQEEFAFGVTDDAITDVLDDAVKNGVGLHCNTNDGVLDAYVGSSSAQTDKSSLRDALTDDEWVELGIRIWGRERIEFFIDKDRVYQSPVTNLPASTQGLTPFFQIETREAAANTFDVDYVGAIVYKRS